MDWTANSFSALPRRTRIRRLRSGRTTIATSASSQFVLGAPSMATISSPGNRPAASAGEPGSRAPMTGGSLSTASTP